MTFISCKRRTSLHVPFSIDGLVFEFIASFQYLDVEHEVASLYEVGSPGTTYTRAKNAFSFHHAPGALRDRVDLLAPNCTTSSVSSLLVVGGPKPDSSAEAGRLPCSSSYSSTDISVESFAPSELSPNEYVPSSSILTSLDTLTFF